MLARRPDTLLPLVAINEARCHQGCQLRRYRCRCGRHCGHLGSVGNKVFLDTNDLYPMMPAMNIINPIRTEADYQQALARIEALFEATPNTSEFKALDIPGTLVCAYLRETLPHHPT